MTRPNFLGIGVAKAGTTWLYELLATHPEVYLPTIVKDVRYFNRFYDRGIEWYEEFFPAADKAKNYTAIGEFTAHYLFSEECPQRIANDLDDPKLLLMLRNPIERSWSQYKHRARLDNYQGSFGSYIEHDPNVLRFSFYSEHIKRFYESIDPDQFLILLFDQVFENVESTRGQLSDFLGIDKSAFPEEAGLKVVNKGYIPRYRSLYAMVAKSATVARERQLHWPVHMAKKIGIKRLISAEGTQPERISSETKEMLLEIFDREITDLEKLLGTDLSYWRE